MSRVLLASFLISGLCISGTALADGSFKVQIDVFATAKSHSGVAKVHITPGAGFHMNKEFPASLSVTPPAGVTVAQAKVKPTKVEESELDFEVAYTPTQAGKKTFTGEIKFAVCSASSCDPKKQSLNFTVDVK